MAVRESFRYFPTGGDPTGLVLAFREADSQTFVRGDLVFLSSNLLTLCGADPASILGIAQEPATNVTSGHKYIKVLVIRPTDVFESQFTDATPAQAVFAATDQAKGYEIVRTSAGLWEVDHDNVGANAMRVKILQSQEFTSDGLMNAQSRGPILVKFVEASGATVGILQFTATV